jgi:pimeloyl-ACP methyl ester carboxylesterase
MDRDQLTLKHAWTTTDGLRVLYRMSAVPAPAGAPTMIHVHGFAISGRYLLPTAARLAPCYPTYVPDLPGFGRSDRPARPLGIPELADALARFMDQVGVERAVLLGNSLGCPIIGDFLDMHPDRIEATIFCSPAGGLHNRPFIKGIAQLAMDGLREPLGMVPIAVADYAHYGILPSINLFRSLIHYPTLERVAELQLPVLVVFGSRDPLVSEMLIRQRATELPHVTAVALDGAAHAINFSHPDQLASVIRAWMERREIVDNAAYPGRVRVIQVAQ